MGQEGSTGEGLGHGTRGLLEPDLLASQVERGSPVCETGGLLHGGNDFEKLKAQCEANTEASLSP